MPASALRILHLEDNPDDAALVRHLLENEGIECDILLVQSREAFSQELETGPFDLILSDFAVPTCDGIAALTLAQTRHPNVPFIFISGQMQEEAAVESLKKGASDYLLKDRLGRLPAAIKHAVDMAKERGRREAAEAALRDREEMFASFMNFSPAIAFLKDSKGRLVYVNQPFEKTFCRDNEEWRGKTDYDYMQAEHADKLREHDVAVLEGGTPLQTMETFPGRDGVLRQWLVCKFPLKRRGDVQLGCIAMDMTEQKLLEQKFLRAQRMESLGTLAGGIAHDLNNVLLPVSLGVEVLRENITDPEDLDVLAMMESSVVRGSALVKQVLTFAKGTNEERKVIQPSAIIKDVTEFARRTFPASISVQCEIAEDLAEINANATQIHQVILNLVVNARDAMERGGVLRINARNAGATEIVDAVVARSIAAEYILLEVSDTGAGIPETVRDKIFDPFFTTKEAGRGTGLGLSTSLGLIKSHGGVIDFTTKRNEGTIFRVFLPAIHAAPASDAPSARTAGMGHAQVILVIDDEAGPRELTKAVLGRHAYQVLTAGNGVEGIEIVRRFRERIDAVIVDYKMPLMTGAETARQIRSVMPALPILGLSGHASDIVRQEFAQAGVTAFLEKPFTTDKLLSTLAIFFKGKG